MGNTCDLCILLCDALFCINYNNDYIRTVYCCYSTDDTVALQVFFDLILTAQSCCIDKHIFLSVVPDIRIDCITGRTCNIGHDHAVLLCQFIDQR